MPDVLETAALELGNMTTVQLVLARRKPFLKSLLAAAGDGLSLSELPLQNDDSSVYVIPKPLEERVRAAKGWQDDADWTAGLQGWGALAVNILSAEVVFRLIELGRVTAALGDQPAVTPTALTPVPAALKGPKITALPLQFQGPYDWHLQCCKVPQAWAMFAGDATHQGGLPWTDIRVGHIDTGYSEHSALAWQNGASTTVDPSLGFDYFQNQTDPRDQFLPTGNPGHGTRTSATIGGFYPTATGTPFYGAAPGVKIVPYRATDSVIIDHVKRMVADAIQDALTKNCAVISISLGGLFGDRKLARALDDAYEKGVIVVCAAGNIWKEVIYPGRYNRCVTMGGVAPGMRPWAGSACGQYVDLCGPAQQVRRLKPEPLPPGTAATGLYAPPDGNGTSYATALCAGVAALWLAWHGDAKLNAAYAQPWMKAAAFKRLLRQTAYVPSAAEMPQGWDKTQYGSGIVDAQALLGAPLPLAGDLHKAKPANDVYDPQD